METTQVINGLPVNVTVTHCPAHPMVETQMRCNRCGRLICLKCAVQTPVGYRCKQCVTAQQAVYFNAKPGDNLLVGLLSFVVALSVTPFVALLGDLFWIGGIYVALFAGPGAGALLTQLVRLVVQRRRSRIMATVVTVGILTGLGVVVLGDLIFVGAGLIGNLPLWVFAGLVITTTYRQLQ